MNFYHSAEKGNEITALNAAFVILMKPLETLMYTMEGVYDKMEKVV